ncbi:hypothetical protein, partial [Bacillus sp. JJ722]|uniref:hypothetical protein n=1 Tax=Bacillus sp. JJ722 TaxID=3122973 RepID=UPI002FFDE4B5
EAAKRNGSKGDSVFMASIEKLLKDLEQGRKIKWDTNKLAKILRSVKDPFTSGYIAEKKEKFDELVRLLNEGYLTIQVGRYKTEFDIEDDHIDEEYLAVVREYEERLKASGEFDIFERIRASLKNTQAVSMKFYWYRKLQNLGSNIIQIRRHNYSLYAEDLQIKIVIGDCNLPHTLESFHKGLQRLIILPYIKKEHTYYYIAISSTTSKNEYIESKM